MEAKTLSECGILKAWNRFEIAHNKKQHIIGYSDVYQFDVISDEIVVFEYDKTSKIGFAITHTGIQYLISGKPLRMCSRTHPLLQEFTEKHACKIKFLK